MREKILKKLAKFDLSLTINTKRAHFMLSGLFLATALFNYQKNNQIAGHMWLSAAAIQLLIGAVKKSSPNTQKAIKSQIISMNIEEEINFPQSHKTNKI